MRSKLKEWDNRNELRVGKQKRYNGWNRRVQWFDNGDGTDIRLKFQDTDGIWNKFYTSKEDAQKDWDAFKKGEKSLMTRKEYKEIIGIVWDKYPEATPRISLTQSTLEISILGIISSEKLSIWQKFIQFFPDKLELLTEEQYKRNQVPDDLPQFNDKWKTQTVVALFKQWLLGDYSLCPILADALQDAGCDYTPMLDELRRTPVYGTWIIPYYKVKNFALICCNPKLIKVGHLNDGNALMAVDKCCKNIELEKIARLSKLNYYDIWSSVGLYDRMTFATFCMYQHGLMKFSDSIRCGAMAQIAQTRR